MGIGGIFSVETPESYYKRLALQTDETPRKTVLEKRKDKIKSAYQYYLNIFEHHSFHICGVIFLVSNILVIWFMMVPFIEQISDPLDLNQTEVIEDGGYSQKTELKQDLILRR